MTEVKGKITKIHCVKTTREWSSDEIFMTVIPVIGKFKDVVIDEKFTGKDLIPSAKIAKGFVTDRKSNVKAKTIWVPQNNEFTVDLNDGEFLSVLVLLYEKDDGKLKAGLEKDIENGSTEFTIADNPKYKEVLKELIAEVEKYKGKTVVEAIEIITGSVSSVIFKLIVPSYKILKKLYDEMKSDDLINKTVVCFDSKEGESSCLPREFTFNGRGGKYKIGFQFEKMN